MIAMECPETLKQALDLGRQHSAGSPEHKQNLKYIGEVVYDFLTKQMGVQTYDELKVTHLIHMVKMMEQRGYSASYIRHALNAVRLATNYMRDYHGRPDLKLEQRHLPKCKEAPKKYLTFQQIATACQIALQSELRIDCSDRRSHPQPLELGRLAIMTIGLCGMRITEFARLTPDALEGNVLTIGHNGSRTKNEASRRCIPVPQIVADSMREYWQKRGDWSTDRTSLAKRIRLVLLWTAAVEGDDTYRIPPKDLRKTLVNSLMDEVPMHYLHAYGGWRFQGTMLRKYASLTPKPDDVEHVRTVAINRLKTKVTDELERQIEHLHFAPTRKAK